MPKPKLFWALDGVSPDEAIEMIRMTAGLVDGYKFTELWDHQCMGLNVLAALRESVPVAHATASLEWWVDIKLHDKPDTVALRSAEVRDAGADILTVHAAGGIKMIKAAVACGPPTVLAVGLLTTIPDDELPPGITRASEQARLARLAHRGGAHGFVCAVPDLAIVRKEISLPLWTPGIRDPNEPSRGQVYTGTVKQAIKGGAHALVLGSTVTCAPDPLAALRYVRQHAGLGNLA